jgi:hypothetical protein
MVFQQEIDWNLTLKLSNKNKVKPSKFKSSNWLDLIFLFKSSIFTWLVINKNQVKKNTWLE